MKWFGRKSAASDRARPALARGGSVTSFGEWPRNYEAQVREGYCHNPVAQRAVKLVSESVGSAPLKASEAGLAALATARSGGQVLIETVAAQLLLHGNAWVQILTDSGGKVRELFALRPERVTVEADANGWPIAYRYRVGAHASRLAAEDAAALGDPAEQNVRGSVDVAVLDAAGALLAASTLALRDVIRWAPGAEVLLLAYLPTVLDRAMPELQRANLPLGWAAPAFDVLQLEDYDWAAAGNTAATVKGVALAEARLGYGVANQHYLAGFVLRPDDKAQWQPIAAAASNARRRGVAETFVWALPQVLRDGFVHFDQEEDVDAFDDVLFPLALGRDAEVTPEVSTAIVTSAGGRENRNAEWAEARLRYDVGPGVRSEADIAALIEFFRARMGPARAFRLRDPFDHSCENVVLGTGDGRAARFQLIKRYDSVVRRITRPLESGVQLAIDGEPVVGFALDPGGVVILDIPPAVGAVVTASFQFDVPVRFAEDRLSVSRATYLAGIATSVPLVEVRE